MTEQQSKLLEPLLDRVADKLQAVLESAEFQTIRENFQKVAAALPESFSLTLNFNLEVFDEKREQSIKLLQMGLTTNGGKPPYVCWGDCTLQRYVVNGEICQLPHDYCPSCWGIWDFKEKHRTCPCCGVQMGKDVKILLDSDVCPNCEKGKVGIDNPTCSRCGQAVDLSIVTWG
jgi:hypothetical protein